MPSGEEVVELLYWQVLFAHANHLLGLTREGHREALEAGRESLLVLQGKLLEAVVGGHIKSVEARGIKISPFDFGGDAQVQERKKLYCFFQRILATGDTLSILQKATACLQKMAGRQDMSQKEREEGIKLFSALDGAFKRALDKKGGKR